ncbi:MAG: hypothetical protein CV089_03270 [Nitrospira sp. WS110]|nr:hypothetical protein [Nitrospira sp. WS110]
MPTPEDKVREQIDKVLDNFSWKVQNAKSVNIHAFRKVTLRHSLFVNRQDIFTEVDRPLPVIEELEATVEDSLTRTERLRQTILQHAFQRRLLAIRVANIFMF